MSEQLVSVGADPNQRLDAILASAKSAVQSLESRMSALADDVQFVLDELGEQRTEIQREREEQDILFSLEHQHEEVHHSPAGDHLRELESRVTEQVLRAETMHRTLTDFASVLSIAARQLDSGRDLPDLDSTSHLAVRLAQIRAREDERRRFARDIHDGPAQAFANAIIGLEFIDRAMRSSTTSDDEAIAEIERVKAMMREGLTEIRRFIFDNRPTMLQDRGLYVTLQHYIEQYQSIFPMMVTASIEDNLPRLSVEQELAAFRIVQESIQNASKHSRASQVELRIWRDDDCVRISVKDNGRGFSPDRVRVHAMGGTGLQSMEERIELVGAQLSIFSEPGEGTEVLAALPIFPTSSSQ
ncbi:MAG: ATP-binding protein [Chloroflexota bacterium]